MKPLLFLITLLMAFTAAAQEEQRGIIIVDGKKFFPLSTVRRHTGVSKPMPVNTERKTGRNPVIILPRRNAELPKASLQQQVKASTPPPANSSVPKTASEQILSIFSPEESYSEKSGIHK